MHWRDYIRVDPQVLHGTACFVGTRVPVSVVLDNLAAGEPPERILEQYPTLRPEHIPAALAYAAELARERVVEIPAQAAPARVAALRFKLDENVARDAAGRLRAGGYDVQTVQEEHLAGEPDPTIAAACQREGRVLVTLDLDFADVRQYTPAEMPGVIVLRPPVQTIRAELALVEQLVRVLAEASPLGQLWIVEPGRIRIRE